MSMRYGSTVVATLLLASTTAFAQTTPAPTTTSRTTKAQESPVTPVTLIGCVQKESDYRREHNLRRAGGLNMGIGSGDEFVLIHATRVSPGSAPAGSSADCTSASSGEAFEITGPQEEKFKTFVGKRVEVSGMQKKAKVAASGQPTGGSSIGSDLKLFEVEVSSVKEAAVTTAQVQRSETPVQAPPATTAPAPAPPPAPTATAPPPDVRQPTQTSDLPRTASPLPLVGLLSLLCFSGAYGVRRLRMK